MIFKPNAYTEGVLPCRVLYKMYGSAMAELYLAQVVHTTHYVVIKGIAADAPESLKEAIRREMAVLGQLHREGIPEFYGYAEEKERCYFMMSYHIGENLDKLMQKRRLSEKEVQRLAEKLCGILAYLHQKGIVHGDIKPSNLIWQDEKAVLLDYGTAAFIGKETEVMWSGTAGYAPPEGTISKESDIYALGMTLRYLLGEKQKKNRWKPVLEKCCAPKPSQRFRSAAELYEALHQMQL